MRKKKRWIIAIILVIICLILFCTYVAQKTEDKKAKEITNSLTNIQTDRKKQEHVENVDNIVNSEIFKESSETKTPEESAISHKTDNPAEALTSAIKDALNEANNSSGTSNIEVLEVESSNKLKIKEDGKEIAVRLIGVHGNGSSSGLQALVDNAQNLQIELDTKKSDGEYKLVYLWDGEPTEKGNNMLNIQMIHNGYAYSTYDFVHPGVIENPNIKYQSLFIDAIKDN